MSLIPPFIALPIVDLHMRYENRAYHSRIPPVRRQCTPVDATRRAAFDALWQSALVSGPNRLIDYSLPYPRMEFLNYLCDEKGLVAHGSNHHDFETLEPVRKSWDVTEFGNLQQVFCSPDAIWATWFAILDRRRLQSTNNACVRVGPYGGRWTKLYYFHLSKGMEVNGAANFTEGTIYLARAEDFPARAEDKRGRLLGIEVEEWGSPNPVTPLARLRIRPEDFPYLNRVEYLQKSG